MCRLSANYDRGLDIMGDSLFKGLVDVVDIYLGRFNNNLGWKLQSTDILYELG